MKKLTFTVTLEFESKITSDDEIHEVTCNVLRAIENEANGQGIAPEKGDTFLTKISVENSVSGTVANIDLMAKIRRVNSFF